MFTPRNLGLRRRRRLARPVLETLESRCLPTTTATVAGTTQLFINGDGGNQQITITETGAGTFRVQASDLAGGSKTFTGIQLIDIKTGGGSDSVTLNGGGKPALAAGLFIMGSGALSVTDNALNVAGQCFVTDTSNYATNLTLGPGTSVGSLVVNGGNGGDTVTLQTGTVVHGSARITLGSGNDTVSFQPNVAVNGPLFITAGSKTNTITLNSDQIGSGDTDISVGSGVNTVKLLGSTFSGNVAVSDIAGGNVALTLQNTKVHGYVMAQGGSVVNAQISGTTIGSDLRLGTNAPAGKTLDDAVAITKSQIGGTLDFETGAGNTSGLSLFSSTVTGAVFVSGSNAATLTALFSTLHGGLTADYGGAAAAIHVDLTDDTVQTDLGITTGSGNDTVDILGSSIGQANGPTPIINTGAGNDQVQIGASGQLTTFYAMRPTFYGGPGTDTLNLAFANFAGGQPVILDFESVTK